MKTLQEKIAVMLAAADGKPVTAKSVRDGLDLGVCGCPSWNWEQFDYDVAPEAIRYRVYVRDASNGHGCARMRQAHVLNESGPTPQNVEQLPGFVGWVHDEWQTP